MIEISWRLILTQLRQSLDGVLFVSASLLVVAGLLVMNSFTADNYFFNRQFVWFLIGVTVMIFASFLDWRFLRDTKVVLAAYLSGLALLVSLSFWGGVFKGAQSWFDLGFFSFQPTDFMKLFLILILAKYFSRRHIEINRVRHVVVSGLYALAPFLVILIQPDFGSAIIIFIIWLGMTLVSGISKRHLLLVTLAVVLVGAWLWFFGFADYQKARIISFINPLADVRGAGYNALQSTIAVGSGQLLGKGIGYGTQSRLRFLPEYQTDFIFAAFAEEWGFVGVLFIFILFVGIFWRILRLAITGASNFETLFCLGVMFLLASHFVIHVGMNVGLFPVTGLTLPFVSYGGSHLLVEFLALGMIMGMRRYSHSAYRYDGRELLGGV